MNKNKSWWISKAILYLFVTLCMLACLLPFLHVAAVSLSSNRAVVSREVLIWPVEATTAAYQRVFADSTMTRAMWFTVLITIIYTVVSMVLTIMAAYPLSKQRLRGRGFFMGLILFTMYFSGGIIPDYLLVQRLGLINSMWALILPGAINAFNLIILRTYFTGSVPDSLEESAALEGLNDIGILIRIVLPLSMPILATLSLFYAVGRWNGFMDAIFYINDPKMYPLPLKIYQLIFNNMRTDLQLTLTENIAPVPDEALKSASIIFTTLPILLIYPWLQRYFVSGVMVGAVKA